MKKIILLCLLLSSFEGFCGSGIWKSEIQINGTTYVGTRNPGNPNPAFNGANLGNFTTAPVTINLSGSGVNTFENSGDNITGAKLFYAVYLNGSPAVFQELSLTTFASGGGGNEEYFNYSTSINITSGGVAAAGTYTIEAYWRADGVNNGNNYSVYDSNNGSNYKATFTVSASALPVTLTKFSGKQTERSVSLSWETQNETNNDFFTIQHSKDLKSWESIGELKGKGTIEQTQAYEFIHTLPTTGANYYRLKQVDFNGQSEFSKAIAVQMPSNPTLIVFPNPTADFIQISGIETATKLQLVSVSGEVVIEKQIEENTTLSLKNLSNGTYFVRIVDKTSSQIKKIILSR